MDFCIRPARLDDIPGMCNLLSQLFSIESDFRPDTKKQGRGLGFLISDISGLSLLLVAERGGEIVGMCSVQVLISTAEGGMVGLLEDLIVHKGHRGNGIGTKLLEEIIKWCRGKNISRLQLLRDISNIGARRFYIRNGLKDTGLVCMRCLLS